MKWTTANVKNPNYTANHEVYVGTHTGSFKRYVPGHEENPFEQKNLYDLEKLNKLSGIKVLEYGKADKSEILIGRGYNKVELHSLDVDQIVRTVDVHTSPVVGLARFDEDKLIVGFENGQIQVIDLGETEEASVEQQPTLIKAGDNMAHLRQCSVQRNLVATGGKERQNNLKVFDMAADGKQVFTSKNLPNDYLQLEVPVWDSDVGFIDSTHTLATCSRYGYVRVYDTRKQRRPVQVFSTENQMSFTTLAATGNYIYTGTTMGALKAFDIRRMKTFVHTYKGFTGGLSDLSLDSTGKFLASACLDRYVRVHHVDSCVLQYQCYVKSKATRVLLRENLENSNANGTENAAEEDDDLENGLRKQIKEKNQQEIVSEDEEYEAIFENMQTIRENEDGSVQENGQNDEAEDTNTDEVEASNNKQATKRKNVQKIGKNKKKKY